MPYCKDSFQRSKLVGHMGTATCRRRQAHCARCLEDTAQQEAASSADFCTLGEEIETVPQFKCLGKLLLPTMSDEAAITANHRKASQSWSKLAPLLVRQGAAPPMCALFYKAIVPRSRNLDSCQAADRRARRISHAHGTADCTGTHL